ncbi:MAG: hypothetical protein AABN33_14025 [Acidobacteriota bacterium]
MNLNGDEQRIQQLFREMSRDDERRAPEFASVVEAASSRTRPQNGTRASALAWAVAGIFIAMLISVSFAVRHPKAQAPTDAGDPVAASKQPSENASTNTLPKLVDTNSTPARRTIPKRVRRKRHSDELAIRMKSLYAWQSPTASLLKAPGEEIFKSLPRLGESLRSIKIFSPDEFN